jgi:hypothetical protein
MSPSMEKTESATTRTVPNAPAESASSFSRCAMSLWRYVFHLAPESKAPSTMDAWSSLSISTRSPGPVRAVMIATLVT